MHYIYHCTWALVSYRATDSVHRPVRWGRGIWGRANQGRAAKRGQVQLQLKAFSVLFTSNTNTIPPPSPRHNGCSIFKLWRPINRAYLREYQTYIHKMNSKRCQNRIKIYIFFKVFQISKKAHERTSGGQDTPSLCQCYFATALSGEPKNATQVSTGQ